MSKVVKRVVKQVVQQQIKKKAPVVAVEILPPAGPVPDQSAEEFYKRLVHKSLVKVFYIH